MKVTYNVKSTDFSIKEGIYMNIDTVYDRSDITEIIDGDGNKQLNIGVEKEYTLKEYFELESSIRKHLEQEDLNNKEAIAELYILASTGGI